MINFAKKGIVNLPDGLPVEFNSDLKCSFNKLKSLYGSPTKIYGFFDSDMNELTDLCGGPVHVGRGFSCQFNNLQSLKGLPKFIGSSLWCGFNTPLNDISDIWDSIIKDTIYITINENMAILPLIKFNVNFYDSFYTASLDKILQKNQGSSKLNILNLQNDLIDNNYGYLAKWKP